MIRKGAKRKDARYPAWLDYEEDIMRKRQAERSVAEAKDDEVQSDAPSARGLRREAAVIEWRDTHSTSDQANMMVASKQGRTSQAIERALERRRERLTSEGDNRIRGADGDDGG